MFSFTCISEHINGTKGNLLTMKQILALFYLTAPLSTPLWESIAKGVALGCCWAQGSAQSLLAQPPCPRWPSWHTQLCSPAGGTSAPVTRSPSPGKVPEPALCSNSSAPAHEPPECLLLMSFSGLCANSCAGSSLTGKLANHFQRTHHICFSRLKQEARALKSAPRPKWEL